MRQFAIRLEAARAGWDTQAALVAAGTFDDLDRDLLARLMDAAVRTAATPPDVEAIARAMGRRTPRHGEWHVDHGTAVVTNLVAEKSAGLAVLVLGRVGISFEFLRTDEIGTPRPDPQSSLSVSWADLLPGVSANEDIRSFQLAGGHGHAPLDWFTVESVLKELAVGPWPTAERCAVLVIQQAPYWTVTERFIDHLRQSVPDSLVYIASPDAGDAAAFATSFIAQAPLRHSYDVVFAHVQSNGAVSLSPLPLFAAGTVAGAQPRSFTIRCPSNESTRLLVPIVACPEATAKHWHLIALGACDLKAGATAEVVVAFDAPGRVRFLKPAHVEADSREWSDVLASLPKRFDATTSDPLDLVLAIELGGDAEHVRQRLDLAGRTIERCQSGFSNPAALRIGLLGYIDHQFGRLRPLGPSDDPVRYIPLQGAAAAAVELSAWGPSGSVEDDLGAPIEDALAALHNFSWRWQRSRHVLMTFGSRPPHPETQESDLGRPCPRRLSWRYLLNNAKRVFDLRCVAVVGPPPCKGDLPSDRSWVDRNRDAWGALGEGGRYELEDADPEQLATAAGVAGKDAGQLLLPLVP